MQAKMNWFGLAGGIVITLLVVISLYVPWWQLTVGTGVVQVNASPLNANFKLGNTTFTIPLLWAFNIASIISLVAGGVAIIIYSINPAKPYSKQLLGFAYRKPLYSLLFFVIGLFAVTLLVKFMSGLDVPLVGSANSYLSGALTQGEAEAGAQGVAVRVLLSAEFQWPFWLATVAAGLCIAARLYHSKVTRV